MKTIIVWFRNDLRIHDHPPLAKAIKNGDKVIPLFLWSRTNLYGPRASSNRNRYLLEAVKNLRENLQKIGGDLVVRDDEGDAAATLVRLAKEFKADTLYYMADYSPRSLSVDTKVCHALRNEDIEAQNLPGKLIVHSQSRIQTKTGSTYRVFTPYFHAWQTIRRRDIASTPNSLSLPSNIIPGELPSLESLVVTDSPLSKNVPRGGETAARERLNYFLDGPIDDYAKCHNDLAADATSRLSPDIHFGCVSVREIETMLGDSTGARAWHRQLAWREFYYYILFHHPRNMTEEFLEKYRQLDWSDDESHLQTWKDGQTGYPIVDAAMRQMLEEGWMHNRARLIVGSFLAKDLWLDWRLGEQHFMRLLLDGDDANNNGNWQWIASVGVDPAPIYRRLYNPSSQSRKFDPSGDYIRRYVPELKRVPTKFLHQPWQMSEEEQQQFGCILGKDYPLPMVDHAEARKVALERYRQSAGN